MSTVAQALPASIATITKDNTSPSAAEVYRALSHGAPAGTDRAMARTFLEQQLTQARLLGSDLPDDTAAMENWINERGEAIGVEYNAYLQQRRDGAPRRYFTTKAHALFFLKHVAPTKLVDGAWLYGVLERWDDPDFRPLIQTYLEELGDGVPDKNHVVLYKKLLASNGCDQWQDVGETHLVQGAIQLALGYDAEHFLPEIIGFNLGYEQLPLHLLITAYELNELGIDPYYFTLHITVDNGGTGHAFKAVQALQQLLPRCGDASAFLRRVNDGYRLNDLGAGTTSVIAEFDLETELMHIMAAKSVVGKNMHSDYCRVGGRSINDWLADPAQIPAMLEALEKAGWIQRGQPADNSRFWRLIQSERAEMFGVFSAYEQQILSDWIATRPGEPLTPAPRMPSFRARQRALDTLGLHHSPRSGAARGIIRHHADNHAGSANDSGSVDQLRQLELQVASMGNKQAAMQLLYSLMTPANHHTASGLMATRLFGQLMNQ